MRRSHEALGGKALLLEEHREICMEPAKSSQRLVSQETISGNGRGGEDGDGERTKAGRAYLRILYVLITTGGTREAIRT